jgi:uncharacterized protein
VRLSPLQVIFTQVSVSPRLADALHSPHTSDMARLFLILAIILLAVLLWRSLYNKVEKRTTSRKFAARDMIRCDYCGLHVPDDQIVRLDGRHYCSKEHMLVDNNR